MLTDIIYCCKMTSVMALDIIMLFLRLKYVTNATQSNYLSGIIHCNVGKLEKAEDFKYVFTVNCVLESK